MTQQFHISVSTQEKQKHPHKDSHQMFIANLLLIAQIWKQLVSKHVVNKYDRHFDLIYDRQNVHPHNGILFISKINQTTDTCCAFDEPEKYAE